MTALDVISGILSNPKLFNANFRYCFVNKDKVPYNGSVVAKPNQPSDFLDIASLNLDLASLYPGLGISIQASNVCAIDVDHCFSSPFVLESGDERAKELLSVFEPLTYCEFSFSGMGLRILFRADSVEEVGRDFYIKNSKNQIEFYQPQGSNRYVTITSRNISSEGVNFVDRDTLMSFLNKYMKKDKSVKKEQNLAPIDGDKDQLLLHYLRRDKSFQDCWFDPAPGSGANESERDFFLLKFILEHISNDKNESKSIFEKSPFFLSKDRKHRYKWEYNDNRYFEYLYQTIMGS